MKRLFIAALMLLISGCVSDDQTYLVSCPGWYDSGHSHSYRGSGGILEGYVAAEPEGVFLYTLKGHRHYLAPYCNVLNLEDSAEKGWQPYGMGPFLAP